MFDINKAIKDSGISRVELSRLQKEVKNDYPHDQLLYELHLIRALKAHLAKSIIRKTASR